MNMDEDELLKMYNIHLKEEEWPNVVRKTPTYCPRAGWRGCATPLLIGECGRLRVKRNAIGRKYSVTPFNMPRNEMGVIELVGTIVRCKKFHPWLQLDVYDGTGTMRVRFNMKKYLAQRRNRQEVDKYLGITKYARNNAVRLMKPIDDGQFASEEIRRRRIQFQDKHLYRWEITRNGTEGKKLEVGDYVNVFGTCSLKCRKPIADSRIWWKSGLLPPMGFLAVHVDAIDEETYKNKLQKMTGGAMKKYICRRNRSTSEGVTAV